MGRKPLSTADKPVQANVGLPPALMAHAVEASIRLFGKPNVAAYLRRLAQLDYEATHTDGQPVAAEALPPETQERMAAEKLARDFDPEAAAKLTAWSQANGPFLEPQDGSHLHWTGLRTDEGEPMTDDGHLLRDWLYDTFRAQEHVDRTKFPERPIGVHVNPVCGDADCINPKHLRP